jgi:hypothetical protein
VVGKYDFEMGIVICLARKLNVSDASSDVSGTPEATRSVEVEYLGMETGKGTSNLAETANIKIRMRTSATGRRRARWADVRESPNTVNATIKNGKIAMAEDQPK